MPTERHMCPRPRCGDRVGKDWAFCQTCRYRVGGSEQSSPAAESATVPGRVGTRLGIIALVAVGAVLAVGGGLMAAGDGSFWSADEMNAAINASLDGTSDDEIVQRFVSELAGP